MRISTTFNKAKNNIGSSLSSSKEEDQKNNPMSLFSMFLINGNPNDKTLPEQLSSSLQTDSVVLNDKTENKKPQLKKVFECQTSPHYDL